MITKRYTHQRKPQASRRAISSAALGTLVLLSIPAPGAALKLFTWEDYVSEQLIELWEQRHGSRVEQVFYDSDEKRDAVLGSSSATVFDLVIVDAQSGQLMGENQILAPVNTEQVPNLLNIGKRWSGSCGGYGLPYSWGTLGLVYRTDKFAQAPSSWAELIDPDPLHQGHIVMHKDRIDTLIPPLAMAGHDMFSENPDELREAFERLQRQLPHVLSYEYVLTVAKDKATRKQIHLALAYSGDQDTLNEMDGEGRWSYTIPKEGTGIWVDCVAVLAASKHREQSYQFLNFLGDASNAAHTVEDIYVASPNKQALRLLSPELLHNRLLFPDDATLEGSHFYRIVSAQNMLLRYRIVNALSRAHETQ